MYIQPERENSFDMPCLFCLFAYLHIYMAHEHYELYELYELYEVYQTCMQMREIGVYWYLFSNQDIARLIPEG